MRELAQLLVQFISRKWAPDVQIELTCTYFYEHSSDLRLWLSEINGTTAEIQYECTMHGDIHRKQ
jgi:hypothetical protein